MRALYILLSLGVLSLAVGCDYALQGREVGKVNRVDIERPDIYNADGYSVKPSPNRFEYRAGVKDLLEVQIQRHPEFSGEYAVDYEGNIEINNVYEKIPVEGKSMTAIQGDVGFAIRRYVKREPEVRVHVKEVRSKKYLMLGQVGSQRAGYIDMPAEEVRLSDALMVAGAQQNEMADLRQVYVIRSDHLHPTYVKVNAERVLMGRLEDNLLIQPGDIIYVPKKLGFKVDEVVQYLLKRSGQVISVDSDFQYLQDMVPQRDIGGGSQR